MAGVVPFSNNCGPGRKQWNIRDKKTVRRLRSQLAEDGCPESQLALAKQLLQEKSVTNASDNEENARLGVFWLMQASEQGCQEATEMLQACLDSAEGITEHNYLDVKACLNTSLNEKLARRAAREMFLSLSSGQDFITTEQLRRRMRSIEDNGVGRFEQSIQENGLAPAVDELCSSKWQNRGEHWGEKLTEDHLEEAASTYSRGELPLVQRVLTLTDPRNRDIAQLPYLHRAVRHPIRSLQYAYASILDLAWAFVYPRTSVILIILLFTPLDNLFMILPMTVFIVSFLIMVISTLQMLQTKREFSHFRVWSQLFLSYDRDGHLNTEDPEYIYIKKNLQPYGVFFLSLLIHLATYPLVSELWIPQSELAVLSFALTFTTLFHFSRGTDFLMLLSFGFHVLAKYPYESDGVVRQTWRFLDCLPTFASQVVGSGVEFCLNFRGVFYLLIPGLFIKMASRERWRGTYKMLIPHCVTLAWWQIAVLSCQGATLYGLIRSTLALVGMVLFLPIVSLSTLLLPVIAFLNRVTEPGLTPVTLTTSLLAGCLLLFGIYLASVKFQYLGKIQMALAVVAVSVLMYPAMNEYVLEPWKSETQLETLTWDQYIAACSPLIHGNEESTSAEIQKRCTHLSGLAVNWKGTVADVRISVVSNPVAEMVSYFPGFIQSRITCFYGEKIEKSCSELKEVCELFKKLRGRHKQCHLGNFDRYEYEINFLPESSKWFGKVGPSVILQVSDSLRNFTQHLKPQDNIWFTGILSRESFLDKNIKVSVDELGCVSCRNKDLTTVKVEKKISVVFNQLKLGFNRILNFLLNPIVIFRTE